MPRLYKRKARTDRYQFGRILESGTIDRSLPRIPFDNLICKKGEMYYTWHPKGSPWQFSSTKPDLRPEWDKIVEDFRHRVCDCVEGESDERDELLDELIELREGLQSNLDNIPEQLQESSVLNERIEELDSLIEQIN